MKTDFESCARPQEQQRVVTQCTSKLETQQICFLINLFLLKSLNQKAELSRILEDLHDFVILDHSGQGFDRISQWSKMDDEGSNMSEPSRLLIDENVSSAPASPGHLVPNSTTVKAGMDYSTAPKMATMVCFHKIFVYQ